MASSIFDGIPLAPAEEAPAPAGNQDLFAGAPIVEPAAPAQVASTPSPPPGGEGGNLLESAARGATFGLSDLAAAAGGASGRALRNWSLGNWGADYEQIRAQRQAAADKYAAENPWLSAGAGFLGGLGGAGPTAKIADAGYSVAPWASARVPLSAPAEASPWVDAVMPSFLSRAALNPAGELAASTLAGQMVAGAGLGAGTGAITAGAESEKPAGWGAAGDVARGAGAGLVVGGALPVVGAVGGRMISPLTRVLGPFAQKITGGMVGADAVENQANRVIAGRLAQDQEASAGGNAIGSLQAALAAAPAGKPLGLVDVGDPNLQALGGKIARQPGAGRAIALNTFGERTGEAGPRIVADINQGLTPETAFGSEQALVAQRRAATKPQYDNFYAQTPLNPDAVAPDGALTKLMQRPSMQDAANRASRIAQEEGRDPNSLGLTFNAAGDPVFEQVPSWQTLDYIKRGLDDHLDQWRNPFGRLALDENGRAALGTQKEFVNFIDANNPAYAPARAAFAGPSQALAALKQGQNFRSHTPEELNAMLGGASPQLNPSEQEFFRIGAADTLRQGAMKTGNVTGIIGSNEANNRGASYLRQQVAPLFTDPAAFQRFTDRAEAEAQMLQTQARLIGGSPTAARVAEDQGGAGGAMTPLVTGLGAFAAGEPVLGGTQTAIGLRRLANLPEINAPAVNRRVAERLSTADRARQLQTLQDILALPRPPAPMLAAPAGSLAGQLATGGGLGQAARWGAAALPFLHGGGQ